MRYRGAVNAPKSNVIAVRKATVNITKKFVNISFCIWPSKPNPQITKIQNPMDAPRMAMGTTSSHRTPVDQRNLGFGNFICIFINCLDSEVGQTFRRQKSFCCLLVQKKSCHRRTSTKPLISAQPMTWSFFWSTNTKRASTSMGLANRRSSLTK